MKISWNHLNDIIELKNINIKNITDRLTLAGLEVEATTYSNLISDTFIKIDITANRQDLNNFIYLATELSALLSLPIELPKIGLETIYEPSRINYKNIIKNINIKNCQTKIKLCLENLDIKTTGTILDTIKIINLKWGQKIQAYYIKKTINALNGDKNKPAEGRRNILEWKSKSLYEINPHNINNLQDIIDIVLINKQDNNAYSRHAYKELLNLLNTQCTPNRSYIATLGYANKQYQHRIKTIICNIQTIENILGPTSKSVRSSNYKISRIIYLLTNLNLRVQKTLKNLIIKIPKERCHDLKHEIDIIEEIGRIYGFQNFQDTVPLFTRNQPLIRKNISDGIIRRMLRSSGLHEAMTYSLIKQSKDKKISIINPLNQELATLRKNLLENLIKSKKYNLDQNNEYFEVFEIGTIFKKNFLSSTIIESSHLCCLVGSDSFNRLNWRNKSSMLTWHQAKGQVEEIFEKLQVNIKWSTKIAQNNFIKDHHLDKYIHANRYIYLNNKNTTIGIFSQLSNRIAHKLNINNSLFFLELNILELLKTSNIRKHLDFTYFKYPQYPQITRDLSIKFNNRLPMTLIAEEINKIKDENYCMIESIKVMNEYSNKKDTKTICFRVIYRSLEKTLTNQEAQVLDDILRDRLSLAIESKT